MTPGNIEERQRGRRRAAVWGAVLFSLMQAVYAGCFWAMRSIPDLPGWCAVLFAVLSVLSLLMILPAMLVLRVRLKEIKGGEEDAAAEY